MHLSMLSPSEGHWRSGMWFGYFLWKKKINSPPAWQKLLVKIPRHPGASHERPCCEYFLQNPREKNMNLWLIFAVIHTCSKGSKIDADELMGWYKRHSAKGKYMDYSPFVQPLRPTRTQEAHGYFPVWRKAHAAPVGIAYDQNPYPGDRDRLRFPLVTRNPPPTSSS